MELIDKIIELAAQNPNDMTLGSNVRKLINQHKEDVEIDERVEKLIRMCILSRTSGLSLLHHKDKRNIVDELTRDGIMVLDDEYKFTCKKTMDYFNKSIDKGISDYKKINQDERSN